MKSKERQRVINRRIDSVIKRRNERKRQEAEDLNQTHCNNDGISVSYVIHETTYLIKDVE